MDRWACQAPALSRPGISRPYTSPHPDRHCERKTAGREQSRYLFSCNLWAGAAPRGRERAAIPCTLPHRAVPIAPSMHTCALAPSPSLPLPSLPLWLSPSPSLPLPLSWPRPCHPRQDPWVHLGPWPVMSQLAGALPPAGGLDIVTAARPGLVSLFLSLISGGPFWSLLYFIVLGGVFGGGGRRRACSHGLCWYLQKLLPKSCLAACGGSLPNRLWVLGGWAGG